MIAKRFARSVSHLNDICIALSFTDYDDIKSDYDVCRRDSSDQNILFIFVEKHASNDNFSSRYICSCVLAFQ